MQNIITDPTTILDLPVTPGLVADEIRTSYLKRFILPISEPPLGIQTGSNESIVNTCETPMSDALISYYNGIFTQHMRYYSLGALDGEQSAPGRNSILANLHKSQLNPWAKEHLDVIKYHKPTTVSQDNTDIPFAIAVANIYYYLGFQRHRDQDSEEAPIPTPINEIRQHHKVIELLIYRSALEDGRNDYLSGSTSNYDKFTQLFPVDVDPTIREFFIGQFQAGYAIGYLENYNGNNPGRELPEFILESATQNGGDMADLIYDYKAQLVRILKESNEKIDRINLAGIIDNLSLESTVMNITDYGFADPLNVAWGSGLRAKYEEKCINFNGVKVELYTVVSMYQSNKIKNTEQFNIAERAWPGILLHLDGKLYVMDVHEPTYMYPVSEVALRLIASQKVFQLG